MNKSELLEAVRAALANEFAALRNLSKQNRSAANDAESRSEGKYDTRATEENYLADGLARQALEARTALDAYADLRPREFSDDDPIDLGAAIKLSFPGETTWFFLGPAGGGTEFVFDNEPFTVITPESPIGAALIGRRAGESTDSPKAKIVAVA